MNADIGAAPILDAFRQNCRNALELATFGETLLEVATHSLDARDRELGQLLSASNQRIPERLRADRVVRQLRALSESPEMRKVHALLFNQCVVLLVSYFAATLSDLFRHFLRHRLDNGAAESLSREELKLSFEQLAQLGWDIKTHAADLFIQAKDVSFQDMQSTQRAFCDWLGFAPERTETMNDIIAGQACRHAIVHSGGRVEARLLRQVRSAQPRSLKVQIAKGEVLQFQLEEVRALAEAMQQYLSSLVDGLSLASGAASPPSPPAPPQ